MNCIRIIYILITSHDQPMFSFFFKYPNAKHGTNWGFLNWRIRSPHHGFNTKLIDDLGGTKR